MKSIMLLLVSAVAFSSCNNVGSGSQCASKESCESDPKCQCWCSVKCGPRKKEDNDRPVYITNDPNGKHCYCNQWDYDHYQDNCVEGKNLKEPAH